MSKGAVSVLLALVAFGWLLAIRERPATEWHDAQLYASFACAALTVVLIVVNDRRKAAGHP